jgi:hypothetical protein
MRRKSYRALNLQTYVRKISHRALRFQTYMRKSTYKYHKHFRLYIKTPASSKY